MQAFIELGTDSEIRDFKDRLAKALQSSHINLLIGSGASYPAIPLAGGVEDKINKANAAGEEGQTKAKRLKYEFLASIQNATVRMVNNELDARQCAVIQNYAALLSVLEHILANRHSSLLPRQANIFTTNYDLCLENVGEGRPYLLVNDGFNRVSGLSSTQRYAAENFFTSSFNTGNRYNYRAEIPSINLFKLHGSLSWKMRHDAISFGEVLEPVSLEGSIADIDKYLAQSAIIFPELGKFEDTVLVDTYYDLLRIYSNSLENENSLLLVFGFSFADTHIEKVTRRSLQNPTLKTFIFAHTLQEGERFKSLFNGYRNVEIIVPKQPHSVLELPLFTICLDILGTLKVGN